MPISVLQACLNPYTAFPKMVTRCFLHVLYILPAALVPRQDGNPFLARQSLSIWLTFSSSEDPQPSFALVFG